MRKIAATYVFPITQPPIRNGLLICEDDGTIVDVINKGDDFKEEAGLEFYSGILTPGFIATNYNLQNHTKTFSRKLWAGGISFAADFKNLIGIHCEKNNSQMSELPEFWDNKVILPGFYSTENTILNTSYISALLDFQEKNKHINLVELLTLISLTAASTFGLENKLGSFDAGKKPGVNLISGINFKKMKLTSNSKIKRLI